MLTKAIKIHNRLQRSESAAMTYHHSEYYVCLPSPPSPHRTVSSITFEHSAIRAFQVKIIFAFGKTEHEWIANGELWHMGCN
jgi:hypothetical protein